MGAAFGRRTCGEEYSDGVGNRDSEWSDRRKWYLGKIVLEGRGGRERGWRAGGGRSDVGNREGGRGLQLFLQGDSGGKYGKGEELVLACESSRYLECGEA